jgi:hypothetical protein
VTVSDSVSLPLDYKHCCAAWERAHDYGSRSVGFVGFYVNPLITYKRNRPRLGTGRLVESDLIVKRCPWCGKKK